MDVGISMKKEYVASGVSICAVVLLVLSSLSNVVGYQPVKSIVENDSPLFQTRTQRATNQQLNILATQYLGMGKVNRLQFPIRENRTELLKRVIEYISKMNDKTFEQLMEVCIQRAAKNNVAEDVNPSEIIQMLHQIRMQPETIVNMMIRRSNERLDPTNFNCYTILFGPPRCYIFLALIFILVTLIYTPILIILRLLTMANCPTAVVSDCPTVFYTFCGTCKVAMR
jgi:hypothetical protein